MGDSHWWQVSAAAPVVDGGHWRRAACVRRCMEIAAAWSQGLPLAKKGRRLGGLRSRLQRNPADLVACGPACKENAAIGLCAASIAKKPRRLGPLSTKPARFFRGRALRPPTRRDFFAAVGRAHQAGAFILRPRFAGANSAQFLCGRGPSAPTRSPFSAVECCGLQLGSHSLQTQAVGAAAASNLVTVTFAHISRRCESLAEPFAHVLVPAPRVRKGNSHHLAGAHVREGHAG